MVMKMYEISLKFCENWPYIMFTKEIRFSRFSSKKYMFFKPWNFFSKNYNGKFKCLWNLVV